MKNQASSALLQALAVCAELTGTDFSAAAARVMADDLSKYPENQVLGALTRCRKELRGRLTMADIISRLDDGRPGVEEAWAMCAPLLENEGPSVVWTSEIALAFGIARQLADDPVAARMAFKEHYTAGCARARDNGEPVIWMPCLGHDINGREHVLIEAQRQGKLTARHVDLLLPDKSENPAVQALIGQVKAVAKQDAKV